MLRCWSPTKIVTKPASAPTPISNARAAGTDLESVESHDQQRRAGDDENELGDDADRGVDDHAGGRLHAGQAAVVGKPRAHDVAAHARDRQ